MLHHICTLTFKCISPSAEKLSAHTRMYSHKGMTSHMCVRQSFGESSEATDSQDKVLMVSNTEISKVEMDGCVCVPANSRRQLELEGEFGF